MMRGSKMQPKHLKTNEAINAENRNSAICGGNTIPNNDPIFSDPELEDQTEEMVCEHEWKEDGIGGYYCVYCPEEIGPDGDGEDD
jgi:hypothetical protein